MANKIQLRRGTKAKLPTLSAGEIGLCTDTNEVYIGNGGNIRVNNKKTATKVIGNSSAGYNAGDVDYLVSGTSNAATVIQNAISALPSSGGKIVFLEGTYSISSAFTISKNVVFEGMGDGTVLNVSAALASSSASVNVTFRDMKITAHGITQYLYTGSGRVVLDNVTLDMMVTDPSANGDSAFENVAFNAVNSRISLSSTAEFTSNKTSNCFAISSYGLYTNCIITVNGTEGGRLHVGRRQTAMNACDITLSQGDSSNRCGYVSGIGNTMTGGTLTINYSSYINTHDVLCDGSYMGVYINLNKKDNIINNYSTFKIIGCHLHNLTVNSNNESGNITV